jgi:hypothetical protein
MVMGNVRVPSVAAALTGVALLSAMGCAAASAPALGPNEALVCSQDCGGVIQVLDLESGEVRELPGAPVALARPMIMPSRQSFMYWQGGDSSPVVLWLVTLPKAYKKLYTAPPEYTLIASTWWPAHYCALSSFGVGDSGRLVMVTPQGVSRELRAKYDQGRAGPVIPLGKIQSLAGLADGTHALASSIGQNVRAVVDVNSGRGVPFGLDWPRRPELGWPWQGANLYLQDPRLNRADGRLYGTLLAYVMSDQSLTPQQKADFPKALTTSSGIYSCKADGSDLRRVHVPPSMGIGTNRFPVLVDLSPDGRRLLFCYYDYGVEGYAVPGLYICHLDGSASRAAPGAGTKLTTAAWGN